MENSAWKRLELKLARYYFSYLTTYQFWNTDTNTNIYSDLQGPMRTNMLPAAGQQFAQYYLMTLLS